MLVLACIARWGDTRKCDYVDGIAEGFYFSRTAKREDALRK